MILGSEGGLLQSPGIGEINLPMDGGPIQLQSLTEQQVAEQSNLLTNLLKLLQSQQLVSQPQQQSPNIFSNIADAQESQGNGILSINAFKLL